ncbi:MAG: MerC domain-containing protein [Dinghuibacter sp.]|nr:MerC domain-containing protein [Dinghuibacter sp.]
MGFKVNWDMLGIGAALACAIHCAVLPIFLTSLPFLGMEIIHNPLFEYGMIVLAFLIGSNALYHGYRKHHHRALPIVLFVAGFCLLLAKQFLHRFELYLLAPAVVAIVAAHWINYRLCRKANYCHDTDCTH